MKAQGFERLTLECPPTSEEALKFWQNQGFKTAKNSSDENTAVMVRGI